MGCRRITRAGERAKLLEAAYGPIRVPVPTVETSQGDIGEDFRLEITGGCRGRSRLVRGRALLITLVEQQVVGQPGQVPCPSDLVDVAQLQRSAILLHTLLRAVLGNGREAQPDLGFVLGR